MIEILLATYNGEKYLAEQLDSLLQQTDTNFRVLIRDDGSTDGTLDIIRDYTKRYPDKLRLITDDFNDSYPKHNASTNFISLMRHATAPYVMFCDQDDVWFSNKVERMRQKMMEIEAETQIPILVFSDYQLADAHLQPIAVDQSKLSIAGFRLELSHLLVQNCVTGCTAMLNRAAYSKLTNYDSRILMHDYIAALYASAAGRIVQLPETLMYYRQHGSNQVSESDITTKEYRIKKVQQMNKSNRMHQYYAQAEYMLEQFGDELPEESKRILRDFASMPKRNKISRMCRILKGHYTKSDLVRTLGELYYC